MEYLHSLFVFALFEDVMLSCCETAGCVRFALFTSGYGYSPPSATLSRDDNQSKMCLLCICERSVTLLIKNPLIHKYPFFDLFSKLVKSFCNINKVFL